MKPIYQRHPEYTLRVCKSQEMRSIDEVAENSFSITPEILMENAGRSASQILVQEYPTAGIQTTILVFAGRGNNAGDAFVVARRLLGLGRRVQVFCMEGSRPWNSFVQRNFEILQKLKCPLVALESVAHLEAFCREAQGPFTIIDGLIGTGFRGKSDGLLFDLIEFINKRSVIREVISLDIPTGINGDTGDSGGNCIRADLTVSFGFPKVGHFVAPGSLQRGKLVNVDISLPFHFRTEGEVYWINPHVAQVLLPQRTIEGYKNSFGHSLLIGGTRGRLGAIELASRAALKVGTGLVTVMTWQDAAADLLGRIQSECMLYPIPLEGMEREDARQRLRSHYASVVVGPGMGMRPQGREVLEEVLQSFQGPVLLDADALNLVAEYKLFELLQKRQGPTVLTPHPGEMSRLLGESGSEWSQDPVGAIKRLVDMTHAIVVLKGAATWIHGPGEKVYLHYQPNDAMAKAGSGDILAGMIGGLLAQSCSLSGGTCSEFSALEMALLGVSLHGLAGRHVLKNIGSRSALAGDLIEAISFASKEIDAQNIQDASERYPIESRAYLP